LQTESLTGVFKRRLLGLAKGFRHRGPTNTLKVIYSNYKDVDFDRNFKTSTSGELDPSRFGLDSPYVENATIYAPTRAVPFRNLLRRLEIHKELQFVDYGAGKGRAMLLAADYGFKKIRGIEFYDKLCLVAKENIKKFEDKYPDVCFEILHQDVASYEVASNDSVFYFFDPFEKIVMDICIKNIMKSHALNPRKMHLIYHNNFGDYSEVVEQDNFFHLKDKFSYWGNLFFTYTNF